MPIFILRVQQISPLIIKLTLAGMKGSLSVIKPLKQRSKSAITNNMFQDTENFEEFPSSVRIKHESYDFVGPAEFRKKLISKIMQPLEHKPKKKDEAGVPLQFNLTARSKNFINTTINRKTVLSSLNCQQKIEATKQSRNLERYKQYQQIWDQNKKQIKEETSKSPTLIECNVKPLYVHQNEDKVDVVNNFIVHYWEMSLRNHNPILERHIKGNTFDKLEKEKMLQLREGTKKIQKSIPKLSVQNLKRLKYRDLSVSGRNKIRKEAEHSNQAKCATTRYSVPCTGKVVEEEVYKISYSGDKRWMGTENL